MILHLVRVHLVRISVFLVAGMITHGDMLAQSRVATETASSTADLHAIEALLARPISVELSGVSLTRAIRTIAALSGVQIQYQWEIVDGLSKPVTVHATQMPVGRVLDYVLSGTGLHVVSDGITRLAIVAIDDESRQRSVGSIVGTVRDSKTKQPLRGATVLLDEATRGVMTSYDGAFRLTGVNAGAHRVIVRLIGYVKQSRAVTVVDGQQSMLDVTLEGSLNTLDQVVVTGTVIQTELRAVPSAITVITAKQIEERGITRIDQLFRGDVPGLFSVNMGSNAPLDQVTMFSRGATALVDQNGASASVGTSNGTNPIKTYVDGVEMADSKYLSQIDPSSIERIEILTGPQASTIYGANAINGVMQIFTKRGTSNRPQLMLNLSSGLTENSFSSNLAPDHLVDIRVLGTENRWSYNIGGSWNYLGSWTPSNQTQRLSINGGGRIMWSKITGDISARQGLTQDRQRGDITQAATDLRATGVWLRNVSAQGLPRPQLQVLNGHTVGIGITYQTLSWWLQELVIGSDAATTESYKTSSGFSSTSDTTLAIGFAGNVATSRISERYSTTMQFSASHFTKLNFILGGDHWRTKGSSWSAIPTALTGASLGNPCGFECARTKADKNLGAFVQGQISLADVLFLTYGRRSDWNNGFGYNVNGKPADKYGVSLVHDIGSVSTKVRGSYGRSIRPISAGRALASTSGVTTNILAQFGPYDTHFANPNLGPEDQRGGEGGIELYFGNRASLIWTRYNQTVDHLDFNVLRVDSVASLLPVFPATTDCSTNAAGGFTFDTDGRCFRYQSQDLNIGSIRNQGWETQGSLNLGPFTTRGTYTWAKSRVLGITPRYRALLTSSTFAPGRPFDFMPEHTWAFGLTYAQTSNTASLTINGVGMMYRSSSLGDALSLATSSNSRLTNSRPRIDLSSANYRPLRSGYATADLNATHRFSSLIDATFYVSNLTNYYQNDFSAQYASIGRQSRAGLRIRM